MGLLGPCASVWQAPSQCLHMHGRSLQKKRAHPDLNQGPADLQSAALTTELCTHMTVHDSIAVFPHLRELVQMPVRLDGAQVGRAQAGWKFVPTAATPNERVRENVHTRSRTWVVAATTRRPNH